MANTPTDITEIDVAKRGICRVHYLLGSEQPVKSTIIGDEPLFYMDYECEDSEEFFGDDMDDNDPFGFAAIESGLNRLQERISGTNKDIADMDRESEMRFGNFLENMDVATGAKALEEPHDLMMADLTASLKKSRILKEYMDYGRDFGTSLKFCTQTKTAYYNREDACIYINPHQDKPDMVLAAIRELRRMWQHRNGVLVHPLTFQPDQAVLVHRAQQADLAVSMIRGAWELQLSGEKEAWERLENSSMSDLTRAFARESFMDFRTLNNGVAASAVFEAWFLSNRCKIVDRDLIQQMLADYQGYVFDSEQSSTQIGAELIIALGTMPFGKNYLAPYINTIINDALFTEVRDRSNANFLWFIKFERSFRETEQELQSSLPNESGEILAADNQKNKRFGDHEEENIVSLPSGGESAASNEGSDGSNVISFLRESGKR